MHALYNGPLPMHDVRSARAATAHRARRFAAASPLQLLRGPDSWSRCRSSRRGWRAPFWRGTRLPTSPPGPVPAAASCAPTGQGPKSTVIGTTGSSAPSLLTKTAEPSAQQLCAMQWARHHYLHHHRKGATAAGNTARSTATVARCSALRSV
jgi:hypothetical protein